MTVACWDIPPPSPAGPMGVVETSSDSRVHTGIPHLPRASASGASGLQASRGFIKWHAGIGQDVMSSVTCQL